MRVCIVGGIFDRSSEYKSKHSLTPETILADGLRRHGCQVDVFGHRSFRPAPDYDVIHVHHLAQGTLRVLSRDLGVPVVFTGHCGPIICGYERSITRKLAFSYAVARSSTFVALSQYEERYIRQRYPHQPHVDVIPNGIPADLFTAAGRPDSSAGAGIDLLYVGQLVELKGVDTLLRALQLLNRQDVYRLKLVYQNARLEKTYLDLAAELGIAEQVQFLGIRSAQELAGLYQAAHMLVLPSHAEALPSVLTEAMLCGVPVVASRVGGIPEQVDHYGEIFTPGDVTELAAAIGRMVQRIRVGSIDGQLLHAYAACKFCVEDMIQSHIDLYREVEACGARHRYWPLAVADWGINLATAAKFGR